ncbi:MAG: DUF1836 domain-containing protein [Erysipelotrichaceae bacterium]
MTNSQIELEKWCEELIVFHLPRWEELPDFEVYMDQVLCLVDRYIGTFSEIDNRIITPAMINNYVKLNMIPKPKNKRYNRVHIAYLISITLLKQVLSIQEVKKGIEYQAKISGLKDAYNLFCKEIESALQAVATQTLQTSDNVIPIAGLKPENGAIKLAALSFASKLVAKELIQVQNLDNKAEETNYE